MGHHKGARTSANWPVRKSSSRRAKRLCKANTYDVVGINAHSKTRVAARKISHHDEQTVYTPSIKPLLTNGTESRTNASTASRASSVAQQHHPAPQAAGHSAPQGAHWQVPRQVCIRPALGGGGMWSTPAVVPVLPRESLRGAPTAAQPVSVLRANSSTALENSPDTRVRTVSSNSGGSRVRKSNPSRAMT